MRSAAVLDAVADLRPLGECECGLVSSLSQFGPRRDLPDAWSIVPFTAPSTAVGQLAASSRSPLLEATVGTRDRPLNGADSLRDGSSERREPGRPDCAPSDRLRPSTESISPGRGLRIALQPPLNEVCELVGERLRRRLALAENHQRPVELDLLAPGDHRCGDGGRPLPPSAAV